jgi:predicted TIM-barrel fold metal-dependent hydrolase
MIIDTHIHVVAEDQQKYPRKVAAGHGDWVRDMSAQSMLASMREAGIDHAIAVQAHGAYEYDNSYAADCAAQYPDRLLSVCVVDPLHREAPAQLTYWVRERGVRGLRLFALDRDSEWLDDSRTTPLWGGPAH